MQQNTVFNGRVELANYLTELSKKKFPDLTLPENFFDTLVATGFDYPNVRRRDQDVSTFHKREIQATYYIDVTTEPIKTESWFPEEQ